MSGIERYIRERWRPRPKPPAPAPTPPGPTPALRGIVRVTNDADGIIPNRGYAYYSQAWVAPDGRIYAFCGNADGRPRFYRITDGGVERLGSLISYGGEAEGWYYDVLGRVYLLDGSRLRRVNPLSGDDEIVMDISDRSPGCDLWQAHSSEDGQVHSATVRQIVPEGTYPKLGTMILRRGTWHWFQRQGVLDESQIDASGRYILIQEDNFNRIVDLETDEWVIITQEEGAVGHCDMGHGFVVGEDDHHGACVRWDLRMPVPPEQRREIFSTWNMGHVSVRGSRCLHTDATSIRLIDLDSGVIKPLLEHGMVGSGYDFQVHANLSPCGHVAAWVSNQFGRMDLFVMPV